jgi:hypothetical protein
MSLAHLSRRKFLTTAALGSAAAASSIGLSQTGNREEPNTFYARGDWKFSEFHKLLRARRTIKQVFDSTNPDGENLSLHIHNALTGLERGFGIAPKQIMMVAALRAGANVLNFDDYAWKKYKLGAAFKLNDPVTGKPAERNIYFASKIAPDGKYATDDPNNPHSIDRDWTLQALQRRGVQLLSCHAATEGLAGSAVERLKLKVTQEAVARDLLAHMLPGVISVPSMVSAIPVLELQGHFAYVRL